MSITERIIKKCGIEQMEMDDPHIQELTGGGLAVKSGNFSCILTSPKLSGGKRLIVESHELGHIALGHLDAGKKVTEREELQADVFAAVLMALNMAKEALL